MATDAWRATEPTTPQPHAAAPVPHPEEIGTHRYSMLTSEGRDASCWRWTCSCGGRGTWTWQSPSVPYSGWLKHVMRCHKHDGTTNPGYTNYIRAKNAHDAR